MFYTLQADYEPRKRKPSHDNIPKKKSNSKSDNGDDDDCGNYFDNDYCLLNNFLEKGQITYTLQADDKSRSLLRQTSVHVNDPKRKMNSKGKSKSKDDLGKYENFC